MKSVEELVERCDRLRSHIFHKNLATSEEVAEFWPEDADEPDLWEWIHCYAQMVRFVGREEMAEPSHYEAEEKVMAGLRDEPVIVNLINGREVAVHPKGMDALLWFRTKDWLVGWISLRLEILREALQTGSVIPSEVTEPVSILERGESELAYQMALMLSQATLPGTGLDEKAGEERVIEFLSIDPIDVLRINEAFLEVNAGRVMFADRLVKRGRQGSKESGGWNVFWGTLSMQLKVDPKILSRDRSLVSLLLQVKLGSQVLAEEALTGE